jgi:hypothetical protein
VTDVNHEKREDRRTEYAVLRSEITHNEGLSMLTLQVSVAAIVLVLGFLVRSEEVSVALVFIPYLLIFASMYLIIVRTIQTLRLGAYLNVFYKEAGDLLYETRLHALLEDNKSIRTRDLVVGWVRDTRRLASRLFQRPKGASGDSTIALSEGRLNATVADTTAPQLRSQLSVRTAIFLFYLFAGAITTAIVIDKRGYVLPDVLIFAVVALIYLVMYVRLFHPPWRRMFVNAWRQLDSVPPPVAGDEHLPVTRLVLIRHAEAEEARGNPHLSARGIVQAGHLCRRLLETGELRKADRLVTSDLERATATARRIAPAVGPAGLEIECRSELREMAWGEGDGLSWDELVTNHGIPRGKDHRNGAGWRVVERVRGASASGLAGNHWHAARYYHNCRLPHRRDRGLFHRVRRVEPPLATGRHASEAHVHHHVGHGRR